MSLPAVFIALAVATAVAALGLLSLMLVESVRERRLTRRYQGERAQDDGPRHGAGAAWVAGMAEGGERIDRFLKNPDETRTLLAQAGWRDARSRTVFYACQFGLPVLVGLLILPFSGVLSLTSGSLSSVLLVAFVVIVSLLAPRYALRSRAKRRRERISAEVPLFINLLVLLFEAGLNMRQALSSLVRDGAPTMPELVDELAPILRQIEAGADAEQLLSDAGKLLAIEELDTVLGILRQVERYGGEIREPLLEALDNLQSKRSMTLREQVNVMSGKMTVVLVTCFFPPLLIFIAGPAFMSISETLGGL